MGKLNRVLVAGMAMATLGASLAWGDTPAPPSVPPPAHRHAQIHQGWRAGPGASHEMRRLRCEQMRLRHEQMRLRRLQRHLRADAHRLRHEERRLHRELSRQSHMIWRLGHDGRGYVY